jgi:hypothetical protein
MWLLVSFRLEINKKMGKVRMLHPSSGRNNFNVVSNQAAASTDGDQASQAANQNQVVAQAVDKNEIEEKTKDAIKAAVASQSQTPSNNKTFDS